MKKPICIVLIYFSYDTVKIQYCENCILKWVDQDQFFCGTQSRKDIDTKKFGSVMSYEMY